MAAINNNTGVNLWLQLPAGNVNQIPNGGAAALVAIGNYRISAAAIAPGGALPVAAAITLTNVGALNLNFAVPGGVPAPFALAAAGAVVLGNFGYNVTP